MIRSLRFRLLVQTSLAATVVLGMLGFALYFCVRQAAESDFNQALLAKARAVAATAEQHGQQIIFDYSPDELPNFATTDHPDYFEAWIDPGVVIRSPSLGKNDLPRPQLNDITFRPTVLPDGRPGQLVGMSFTTTIESNAESNSSNATGPRVVILTVATDTIALQQSLKNFRGILIGLCCLAIVASGAVLVWVVGRGVRPVERLAGAIERLQENDLSVRLQAPDVPTELEPVVDKLNGLLSRLDGAFAREKSFTADVAHELRTPLSALLTTFEVCRSRPRDESVYITAIDKCRDVARGMQGMVETLLILTRADAGQLSLTVQNTDVAALLEDCWALFEPQAKSRNLHIEWQVPDLVFIDTDPEKLRIILHNIFDNAVSYTNDAGKVRVTAEVKQERLVIEIANTGSKIPADRTAQLFDRFWRGDQARTETGVHCGLGLSLCQRLSRLLNGQIEIQSTPGEWFIVRLSLPATSQHSQCDDSSISELKSPRAVPA
jgi:two-component system heavy metal sensor histidine kinase CusS